MKKKYVLLTLALLPAVSTIAQQITPVQKSFKEDPFNHPMLPSYVVLALLFISIVLVAVVCLYVLRIVRMVDEQLQRAKADKLGVEFVPTIGWWQKFSQRMNASVPVDQEKNIELDHSYDGIKELDNHLPPWWKWLFYGTIGWAAVYIVVFHFLNTMPLSLEEYNTEIAVAEEQARQRQANQPATAAVDENKLEFVNDPAIIEKGKNVFANNPCGSCHRNDGGGNAIGPNLTDEFWIHGGDVKSIFTTIKDGAVEKGMPAWGKAMSAQDVRDLTFYILSLQGSNPPDGKAPQGDRFTQTTTVKTDSTNSQASL